jgi:hypothetical protein
VTAAELGFELLGGFCDFVLEAALEAVFKSGSAKARQPKHTDGLTLSALNERPEIPQSADKHGDQA